MPAHTKGMVANSYAATLPPDTTATEAVPQAGAKQQWYKSKVFKAVAVPVVLIGYGASTINGHGFYSSYQARNDIYHLFGKQHLPVDNVLQFFPFAQLAGAALLGVQTRNDRVNTLLLVAKSQVLNIAAVYIVKYAVNLERPNGGHFAFPSGHTAQAFMAATIVQKELGYKSPWYGATAYTVAGGVGLLRMVNNKHWESDVFAGAGFGIFSTNMAYLTHRYRWGRKPIAANTTITPTYGSGQYGLYISWRP